MQDPANTGGVPIPRTTKAPGPVDAGADTGAKQKVSQAESEKTQRELEIERATLQSEIDKQRAEAERDVLRETLEKESTRAADYLEQVKAQTGLLKKTVPRSGMQTPEGNVAPDKKYGYVAEMVGYQALKRVSQDIIRRLTIVEGLPKDARILIVDSLNYAPDDIPLIEISAQFGMFEARCRKQVADNRELLDFVMQREEKAEPEMGMGLSQNEASKRFAFLATVPALAAAATSLPAFSGIKGTVADIAGHFRTGLRSQEQGHRCQK